MRVVIDISQGYANAKGVSGKYLEVVDVPDYLAAKLIGHGIAKPAPPAPVIEAEVAAPPENAAQRTGKVKRAPRQPDRKGA